MRWLLAFMALALYCNFLGEAVARIGGAGGAPYDMRCQPGDFVRGFRLMQGDMLDSIVIYCGKSDGRTVTGAWEPGTQAGGRGGRAVWMMCGKDELVSGLEAKARNVGGTVALADLKVFCTHVASGKRRTLRSGWSDPDEYPDPYGYRALECPGTLLGRGYAAGITGGAGNWVDSIDLACGVLNNPDAEIVPYPGEPDRGSPRPPIREVGKRTRCRDYAQNASAIRDEAAACGLTGPRFDATYDQHYAACLNNGQAFAAAETRARAEAIAKCRAMGGGSGPVVAPERPNFCNAYAQDATAQAQEGQQNCGFAGPRYSAYTEDHLNWCRTVAPELANAERAARGREIAACRQCRAYAERALDQFRRTNACRSPVPNAPYWQPNPYEVHFGWCLQTGRNGERTANPAMNGETSARERDLKYCQFRPLE